MNKIRIGGQQLQPWHDDHLNHSAFSMSVSISLLLVHLFPQHYPTNLPPATASSRPPSLLASVFPPLPPVYRHSCSPPAFLWWLAGYFRWQVGVFFLAVRWQCLCRNFSHKPFAMKAANDKCGTRLFHDIRIVEMIFSKFVLLLIESLVCVPISASICIQPWWLADWPRVCQTVAN